MKAKLAKRDSAHFDRALWTWQEQVAQAEKNPGVRQGLLNQECEVSPRFASHYASLTALPRRIRRAMQGQWQKPLAVIALLLTLGQVPPALAATINVGGTCTLPRAIAAANADTPVTGCKTGSGADTIVLPAGSTQTLTSVNNTAPFGATGLPIISSVVTIDGNGGTIRRAPSAPAFRILAVRAPGSLTLRRITVTGGLAPAAGGNSNANDGGGLLNVTGNLAIVDTTIAGNRSTRGGGVASQGTATSTARVNLTVINSTISGNTAVTDSGNVSGWGGGVDVDDKTNLVVTNSTLSGNRAERYGGGLYSMLGSRVTMTNSTVSRNSAVQRGGGMATGCATIKLSRTLVSGNTAPKGAEMSTAEAGCQVATLSFNLYGHSGLSKADAFHIFAPGPTDLTATANGNRPKPLVRILSATLANNGGPSRTHALVPGSPALDIVTDGTCPPPATDQRGIVRPRDGNADGASICDIGAFEG